MQESSITLQPGLNRLTFRVSVLKQGLYVLKHVRARLGRLSLLLRSALPVEGGPPPDVMTSSPALAALSDSQPQPAAIGSVDPRGKMHPTWVHMSICIIISGDSATLTAKGHTFKKSCAGNHDRKQCYSTCIAGSANSWWSIIRSMIR